MEVCFKPIRSSFHKFKSNLSLIQASSVITAGHFGAMPRSKNRLCPFLLKIKKKYFLKKYTALQDILRLKFCHSKSDLQITPLIQASTSLAVKLKLQLKFESNSEKFELGSSKKYFSRRRL
jgi:hypothetical protein